MILRNIYNFLSSAKLAMALLVVILVCCLAGVTVIRGERAWVLIFSTLWFNAILVLLVVNVAFCFFGRIWGRKVTVISFGMILFHLSFVAILGGIVYNSLFYFRGVLRLTEGETLPNTDLQSYDLSERGLFFDLSKLKGETTLVKMHAKYRVDGVDKKAVYEISVGEGILKNKGVIYITKHLGYRGFNYFPDKEGYSVLVILLDKQGKELYGLHIPLQSLKQGPDAFFYTTGTKEGPGNVPFPQDRMSPLFNLQVAYFPDRKNERAGDVMFYVWPLAGADPVPRVKAVAEGRVKIGERFNAGNYDLQVREVRYWAAMNVRYEPGKPIVLASLWVGLGGLVITFIGRMRRSRN